MTVRGILLSGVAVFSLSFGGFGAMADEPYLPTHILLSPAPLVANEVGSRVADRADFDLNGGMGDPDQLWTAWAAENVDSYTFPAGSFSHDESTWSTFVGVDKYSHKTYWGGLASYTAGTGGPLSSFNAYNPQVITVGVYAAPIINESNNWVGYGLFTSNYFSYSVNNFAQQGFNEAGLTWSGDYNLLYRGGPVRVRLAVGYQGFDTWYKYDTCVAGLHYDVFGDPLPCTDGETDNGAHVGIEAEYPLGETALGSITPFVRADYISYWGQTKSDLSGFNYQYQPTELVAGARTELAQNWAVSFEGGEKWNFDTSHGYKDYTFKLAVYKRF